MNKLIALVFGMAIVALCSCATPERTKTHKTDCPFFANNTENQFLECSVRVNKHKTGISSGTIIKVKENKNKSEIIVLSTGHMRDRVDPEIEIFYANGKRLKKPVVVKTQVLLLVENGLNKGIDFCLLKGEAEELGIAHKPLAPESYDLKDADLYSVGCDLGIEPKFFKVRAHKTNQFDLEIANGAGVGRSGGGLFTVDGKYVVGVCWGGGENHTIFTSHKTINKIVQASGLEEELK